MNGLKVLNDSRWEAVSPIDIIGGDIFFDGESVYVSKGPCKVSGDEEISVDHFHACTITLFVGSDDRRYISEVMSKIGCVSLYEFEDGTAMLAEFESDKPYIYSPRLSVEDLEQFCMDNIALYNQFTSSNSELLNRCQIVEMKRFW